MITPELKNNVKGILLENERTRRPGRGGYKREIQAAGALAQKNPAELIYLISFFVFLNLSVGII